MRTLLRNYSIIYNLIIVYVELTVRTSWARIDCGFAQSENNISPIKYFFWWAEMGVRIGRN